MAGKKGATRKKRAQKAWTNKKVRKAIAMRRNGASIKRIARELDRSPQSVKYKLQKEGIRRPARGPGAPWQPREKDVMRTEYSRLGAAGIYNEGLLPGRSKKAIREKARVMRLAVNEDHPQYKSVQVNKRKAHDPDDVAKRLEGRGFKLLEPYAGSTTPVLMECTACGAQERKRLANVSSGRGCMACSGYKQKTSEWANEWMKAQGLSIRAKEGSNFSCGRRWGFYCLACEFEWETTLNAIKNVGTRCPGKCLGKKKESWLIEIADKIFARKAQCNIRPEWLRSKITGACLEADAYYADIGPAGLAIEGNGLQHYEEIEGWGGTERLKVQQANDQEKGSLCAARGTILIRVNYSGVKTHNEERAKKEIEALLIRELRACGNEEVRRMVDAYRGAGLV